MHLLHRMWVYKTYFTGYHESTLITVMNFPMRERDFVERLFFFKWCKLVLL